MTRIVNLLLAALKWPCALIGVALLACLAEAVAQAAALIASQPDRLWLFGFGAASWLVAWTLIFRRRAWGSWLPTLLHELTHALAAWLTFHRVVGLRASWRSGGEIEIVGGGNWFIAVAPYWLPLPAVAVAIASLSPAPMVGAWRAAGLGVALAWQATVLSREIHRDQEDLRRAGWLFCACTLPAANLLVVALGLAWAALGPAAAGDVMITVGEGLAELVARAAALASG